jgi:hypothetical protein
MAEIHVTSGEFKQIENGNLVNSMEFEANSSDGEIWDVALTHNDEDYYTQIPNSDILELLNLPTSKINLPMRLLEEFPIDSTHITNPKPKKKTGKNTKKKKKKEKKGKGKKSKKK